MSMMRVELDFLKKDRAATPAGQVHQASQNVELLKTQQRENGGKEDKSQRTDSGPPIFTRACQGLESKFDHLIDNVKALKHENELLNLRLCENEGTTQRLARAIDSILDDNQQGTSAKVDARCTVARARCRTCHILSPPVLLVVISSSLPFFSVLSTGSRCKSMSRRG